MADIYLYEIMQLLREKFPDAVEFRLVDTKTVYERTFPAGSAGFGKVSLYDLVELEPETEIYGVMSPITRVVYTYITWKDDDPATPDSAFSALRDKLAEDIASAMGVPFTVINSPPESLTLDKVQQAIDLALPVLYYNADPNTARGKIIYAKAGDLHPEFVVFHPEDFEEVKRKLPGRRLVHIKEYRPRESSWPAFRPFERCEHGSVKNLCSICETKEEG